MTPTTDECTSQLYALLLAASMRVQISQGEVRAFLESFEEMVRAPKRRKRSAKLKGHAAIKAEVERQRRGDRG